MASTDNITTGAPLVAGAIYRAPLTASLPTSALTSLGSDFVSLGYISEDGYSNSYSRSTKPIKDWSGNTVLSVQEDYTDTFKYKMLEVMDANVLKEVFGDGNVSGTLATELVVAANATELTEHAYVIDVLLKGGYIRRTVIPKAKITEIAEITYKKSEPVGYEVTLTAYPDANGNTHKEYTAKPSTPGNTSNTNSEDEDEDPTEE